MGEPAMKPHRLLVGNTFDFRDLHVYPNVLTGEGAEVVTHKHARDHASIVIPLLPRWLEAVIAVLKRVDRFGWLGFGEVQCLAETSAGWQTAEVRPLEMFYIGAGVRHKFVQVRPNGRAAFVCIFSNHGPNGEVFSDPKMEAAE